jgi:membrane-anchored protein YejM (alkaline phosphatase superfamily)
VSTGAGAGASISVAESAAASLFPLLQLVNAIVPNNATATRDKKTFFMSVRFLKLYKLYFSRCKNSKRIDFIKTKMKITSYLKFYTFIIINIFGETLIFFQNTCSKK